MIENGNLPATMLVSPTGNYGGGFGGFGGDWGFLLLLLLCANGGWGMGGFGGWGGMMGMGMMDGFGLYPWLNNSQNINDGFRDQQLSTQVSNIQNAITSGFGDVQTALCSGFAGVEQGANARQIANMQTDFAMQNAINQGFNGVQSQLAQCCCDNRLASCQTQNIIQNEGNQTRFADAQNTRDIIESQNRGNQAILDKLCQLELDGYKQQIDAKNDIIAQLRQENLYSRGQASQVAQTAELRTAAQTANANLLTELRNCPIPAQAVYGNQPVFTCQAQNNCGCQGFYN